MDLPSYLRRIEYRGDLRPDLPTLQALHRAHLNAVPFENLDVQLRRPLDLSVEASYDKIVNRHRGGWCYEMNGLFGWALEQIGFEVMRVSAGVMREQRGDAQLGGHLCLLVQLERPYLTDVGFGGSMVEPLALERGTRLDAPYHLALAEADDGFWRFSERVRAESFGFDFSPTPADESLLARKCHALQTEPASPFVQNLVAQRRVGESHVSLRGRVVTVTNAVREDKVMLHSPAELVDVLRDAFELDVPEAAALWPAICARHEAVFGDDNQASL